MNVKLSATQKQKQIFTAQDIYSILQPILLRENRMRRKQEYFWIAGIDANRHLVFIELLALGAQNRVIIKAPEAFRMAIYKLADYVMFIHNHPVGKLQPSEADKDTTNMLIKAGQIVNIKVVDHLIINEKEFYSMATAGLLKQLRDDPAYQVLHQDEVELLKLQHESNGEQKRAEAIAIELLKRNFAIVDVVAITKLKKKVVEGLSNR